jgi:hypothetical protein
LYLDGFTWFRRRSGGDDEIALGCIYLTLHHLTDLSDRINNGCSGGVGREPGKRLKTAGVLGIVGERQDEGLLRRQSGCSGLQNLNDRLIRRVKPSKHMLGDKAYDSAELRCELHERGSNTVIPNKSNKEATVQLQQPTLQAALAHRKCFQQAQALQAHCHPL